MITATEITRMGRIVLQIDMFTSTDRLMFASYGTHAMNYFASLVIFMRQGPIRTYAPFCFVAFLPT